jgi:hypothetical protein
MRRFFISQHPTFGSYKEPIPIRIEQSPYYWWWYALTLNTDYIAFCHKLSEQSVQTPLLNRAEKRMYSTFKDFGDVRYDGCRYKAFTKWWTSKATKEESRGEYLFAEPFVIGRRLTVIDNIDDARIHLDDENFLVIAIPLTQQRQRIEAALDRHLKKHLRTKKGREARNPTNSKARYRLSKPYVVGALKKTFDLYTAKLENERSGKGKLSNAELAKQCRIHHKNRKNVDYVSDEAAQRRVISIEVSRYLATARKLIGNATIGTF